MALKLSNSKYFKYNQLKYAAKILLHILCKRQSVIPNLLKFLIFQTNSQKLIVCLLFDTPLFKFMEKFEFVYGKFRLSYSFTLIKISSRLLVFTFFFYYNNYILFLKIKNK